MIINEIFNADSLVKEFMKSTGYQDPKKSKITWGSYICFLQDKLNKLNKVNR